MPTDSVFEAKSCGGVAPEWMRFAGRNASNRELEHDPEKWTPVFRKDHAQTKS
jgi:hypothetical protein